MTMTRVLKSFLLTVLTVTGINMPIFAQQEWRTWGSLNLNVPLTKKIDVRVGHLRSYGINTGFNNNFNQIKLEVGYDLPKRWDVSLGSLFMQFPSSAKTTVRGYVEVSRKIKLSKQLNWFNTLHLETNSANENRFRNRVVLSTRLGLTDRLAFLKLAPSIAYSLYYNSGGSTVDYYDTNSQLIISQSPNGFHRGRLTVAVNSKISKAFRISLYYLNQNEFNLGSNKLREMNVLDPTTGKTQKSFSNYNVVGLTLSFTLGNGGHNPLFNTGD